MWLPAVLLPGARCQVPGPRSRLSSAFPFPPPSLRSYVPLSLSVPGSPFSLPFSPPLDILAARLGRAC
jgi:hypothetical protein